MLARSSAPLWLLIAGILLLGPTDVHAQRRPQSKPDKDYLELPHSGNLEDLLKARLGMVEGHQQFEELFQKLLQGQIKLDPELLKKIDLNNPLIKQKLKTLVGELKVQKAFASDPEKKKALDALLKRLEGQGENPVDPLRPIDPPEIKPPVPDPNRPPPEPMPPRPDLEPGPKPDNDFEEGLAKWLKEFLEDMEDSKLHGLLHDSPAIQEAIQDFQQLMEKGEWGKWEGDLSQWKAADWFKGQADTGWLKMPELSLPEWQMPQVSLPKFNLGFSPPSFGKVPMPGMPSLSAGSTTGLSWFLLGLLALAVGGLLIWQLRIGLAQRAERLRNAWQLGPWPVDPRQVRTRRELVLAFNYLALLLLGPGAQPCNHRDIARQLLEKPSARDRAGVEQLAVLYEQARYAPDDETLPVAEIDLARRHLCTLAGVASA